VQANLDPKAAVLHILMERQQARRAGPPPRTLLVRPPDQRTDAALTSEGLTPISNQSSKSYGEQKAKVLDLRAVDEGRNRVLLIAASIFAARKLAQIKAGARVTRHDVCHRRRDTMGRADHGRN
jgi:hypothetical protein